MSWSTWSLVDCSQKHLHPHQGLTALSITDTKRLKLQLSFFDNQMCSLLFLVRNCTCCLLISFDLHLAPEFLDGWRVVDVINTSSQISLSIALDWIVEFFLFIKSASNFVDCRSIISKTLALAAAFAIYSWILTASVSYSAACFLSTNDASALNSAIRILSAMALSLVYELLDRHLTDFEEDLLECGFFPNEDRLDSLSSDSSFKYFNQLCTWCLKVHTYSSSLSNHTSSFSCLTLSSVNWWFSSWASNIILNWSSNRQSSSLIVFIFWNEYSSASIALDLCSKCEWSLPVLFLECSFYTSFHSCLRKPYCFVSLWWWLILSAPIFW